MLQKINQKIGVRLQSIIILRYTDDRPIQKKDVKNLIIDFVHVNKIKRLWIASDKFAIIAKVQMSLLVLFFQFPGLQVVKLWEIR